MTVAYSAYSKKDKKFVIGADDLEGKTGRKVSKIRTIRNRYVICVTGCDNPIHAFDMGSKDLTDQQVDEGWPDVNEFMDDIGEWTKQYTECQIQKHSNTTEVKALLSKPSGFDSTVIVFDLKIFDLFKLEIKGLYPLDKFDSKKTKRSILKEDVINLHAMAKNRTSPLETIPLNLNIYSDPENVFKSLIKLDKDYHDRARLTQPDVPKIGDLGSFCHFDQGNLNYVEIK